MKCSDAEELFSNYAEREGDPALSVSLENHLATCTACTEALAGLRHVWNELDNLPSVEPPAYFHQNLMARVAAATMEEAIQQRKQHPVWNWKTLFQPRQLAFAASALILVLAGMEVAHTTNASMDPLGVVNNWFFHRQGPLDLNGPHAEWKQDDQGQNILVLHLQAMTGARGQTNRVRYHVQVVGAESVAVPAGVISSDREKLIPLSVHGEVASGAKLEVTLTPLEDDSGAKHVYDIPMVSP